MKNPYKSGDPELDVYVQPLIDYVAPDRADCADRITKAKALINSYGVSRWTEIPKSKREEATARLRKLAEE